MSTGFSSKLRADAPVFLPSFLRTYPENAENQAKNDATPTTILEEKGQPSPSQPVSLPSSQPSPAVPPTSTPPPPSKDSPASPPKEDWDERLRKEVVEASELVWAQAEAWIEAEFEAEEEEWRILEMGINEYVGLGAESPGPYPPGLSPLELSSNSRTYGRKTGLHISTRFDDATTTKFDFSHDDQLSRGVRLLTPTRLRGVDPLTPPFTAPKSTLHNKLSSPDRRRSMSPSALMRRYEAKLSAAEVNRDRSVAVKVQKASLVTSRVKERLQKAAEKQLQAEEALQDRLRSAEQRHNDHLNGIRERAGNENARVLHTLTVTLTNNEALAASLQQKLEEVEARILAASLRREQRLAGIAGSQKKKNHRKVVQMSEFKLQLEKQKMERWERLQQRLELVKQRREARFAELKRRAEAEARRQEAMAALHSAEKGAASEGSGGLGSGGGIGTHSNLGTPIREKYRGDLEGGVNLLASPTGHRESGSGKAADVSADLQTADNSSSPSVSTLKKPMEDFVTVSEDLVLKCIRDYSELKARSKLSSAYQETWKTVYAMHRLSDGEECGSLHSIVEHLTQVESSADERGASNHRVYMDVLLDIHRFNTQSIAGNYSHSIVEKVNFLAQSASTPVQGVTDQLAAFAQCGGIAMVAVLLSAEYGLLSNDNREQFLWFLHYYNTEGVREKGSMNVDYIEYYNLLVLLQRILKQDCAHDALSTLVKYGLHISLFEISFVLLTIIHSLLSSSSDSSLRPSESASSSSISSPLLLKCMSVYKLYNLVVSVWSDLVILALNASSDLGNTVIVSLMNYSFPCNYLSLLGTVGKSMLNYVQTPGADYSLQEHDRHALYYGVSCVMSTYSQYIKWLRDSGVSTSVQPKHWLSMYRRCEIYQLVVSFMQCFNEDMVVMVQRPSRFNMETVQSLSRLLCAVLRSIHHMQLAETEAFAHLGKEQQHKLIGCLQISLCFFTTVLVNRPFPQLDETTTAQENDKTDLASVTREEGVAEICQIISHISKHSIDARHLLSTVNSSAKGAGSKPLSSPGQCSLMLTLASLPIRFMKENSVKNALMPCFIVSCLEMESNVNIVKRCGKASYVRKYLEVAINEYLEAIRAGTSDQIIARKSKLRCMTDLLAPEMWQVALLAWSADENMVKTAKI